MKRTVTIHKVADRHEELHGRRFMESCEVTVESLDIMDAIKKALNNHNTKLANYKGKVHIVVDWPHT
jgi:hypothetical protein